MSDSRRFSRNLAATGLFLGPLLFFLSSLVDPAWADDPAAYFDAVAASSGRYLLAGLMWTVGSLVFIPGVLGLIKLMRGRGITVGQVGAGLIAIGLILLSSSFAFYALDVTMARSADRPAAVAIYEAGQESSLAGVFYMVTFLGGIVLGSLLLAVALFKRRIVPVWSPVLVVASTVVGFFAETQMLNALSLLLLVAGLAPLAQRIRTLSDEAWAQWEPLPADAGQAKAAGPNPSDPHPA
ncbi:MAG: DUF4386 family protein [Actinomycetota bacterium]